MSIFCSYAIYLYIYIYHHHLYTYCAVSRPGQSPRSHKPATFKTPTAVTNQGSATAMAKASLKRNPFQSAKDQVCNSLVPICRPSRTISTYIYASISSIKTCILYYLSYCHHDDHCYCCNYFMYNILHSTSSSVSLSLSLSPSRSCHYIIIFPSFYFNSSQQRAVCFKKSRW